MAYRVANTLEPETPQHAFAITNTHGEVLTSPMPTPVFNDDNNTMLQSIVDDIEFAIHSTLHLNGKSSKPIRTNSRSMTGCRAIRN